MSKINILIENKVYEIDSKLNEKLSVLSLSNSQTLFETLEIIQKNSKIKCIISNVFNY